jgi:GST-like protein
MANQGPKSGEAGHFRRLGDKQGDQSYAVRRFTDEVNRLFGVLNNRLYDRPYLAGEDYSIADIACYPWATSWAAQGQDIEEFTYVKRWLEELTARPAVQRGMTIGKDLSVDPATLPPEELERRAKILFNQRALPVPSEAMA